MTDLDRRSGAPTSLPALRTVDVSGEAHGPLGDSPGPGAGASGPAATMLLPAPHERDVTEGGEALADLYTGLVVERLLEATRILADLTAARPLPWEYRGPLRASTFGTGAARKTVVLGTVPAHELWEVERLAVDGDGTVSAVAVHDSDDGTFGFVAAVAPSGAQATGAFDPPLRFGAGATVIAVVTMGSAANQARVRAQYRMARLPTAPCDDDTRERLP